VSRHLFDDERDDEFDEGSGQAFEEPWLDEFYAEGLVTDILMPLKSGKEASVYLCRANPSTGERFYAAKVFRARRSRAFKDDSMYKHGRVITNARTRRAVQGKTRFGREMDHAFWIGQEFETLSLLFAAGADVPRPVYSCPTAILMQYVGDEAAPAPQLKDVRLERDEAGALFDRLMWNVELMLSINVIHGDLSPYNVLYQEGKATIIDLPQAVDPRTNANARHLLARDLDHLCRYFARFGVRTDAIKLASNLWRRFVFATL